MSKAKVLIVEDDKLVCLILTKMVERSGYEVADIIAYGEKVIESIESRKPDLVLMDTLLKGEMDGIEATKEINRRWDMPVIYITGLMDEITEERASQTKYHGYIQKPINYADLQRAMESIIAKKD
jgi:CheY-like chemotaxis protein